MDKRKVGYWVTTVVIAFVFLVGGIADIAQPDEIKEIITHLGYPAYAYAIIGFFKVVGAVVIAAPKLARLKEWAYAGVTIDLLGALGSHLALGDGAGYLAAPVLFLTIALLSWHLRPDSRRLA